MNWLCSHLGYLEDCIMMIRMVQEEHIPLATVSILVVCLCVVGHRCDVC